jgi:hypothetical protein
LRFESIAKSKGTELHDVHLAASSCFHATKRRLYRSAEERNRKNFFETIDTKEVNNQLDPEYRRREWKQEPVQHILLERQQVAELLRDQPSVETEQAALGRRIVTAEAMIRLCSTRLPSRQRPQRSDPDWGISVTDHLFLLDCDSS